MSSPRWVGNSTHGSRPRSPDRPSRGGWSWAGWRPGGVRRWIIIKSHVGRQRAVRRVAVIPVGAVQPESGRTLKMVSGDHRLQRVVRSNPSGGGLCDFFPQTSGGQPSCSRRIATIGQEKPESRDVTTVIEAHDRVRAEAKLPPLKVNAQLTEAGAHARDMAAHQKMSHDGSDGSTVSKRVKQRGYHYQEVGENIATAETSDQAMQSWLDSPPHLKNILDKLFTEIGVAMVPDSEGHQYWCVNFARPRPTVDTTKASAAMIAALNRTRSEAKRSSVKADPKLTRVADEFARDLAARHTVNGKNRDGQYPLRSPQGAGLPRANVRHRVSPPARAIRLRSSSPRSNAARIARPCWPTTIGSGSPWPWMKTASRTGS